MSKRIHSILTEFFITESDLVKLAQEVLELVRGQFDKQTFAEVFAKVQKKAHEKRESRKRKLAVEVSFTNLLGV